MSSSLVRERSVWFQVISFGVFGLLGFALLDFSTLDSVSAAPRLPGGRFQSDARTVIVHPKLGGQILGYDIDRNGTEGLLSEYVSLGNGNNNVATEIFDQKSGKIIKVVAKKLNTQDDFATLGIFAGVGLDLVQHVVQNHVQNRFLTINPLSEGKFTGKWTPPTNGGFQLESISVSPEGAADAAAYEVNFNGSFQGKVFSSNIATNTFGRAFKLQLGDLPLLAYDSKTNVAVLAHSGTPTTHPVIQMVNLANGKVKSFSALGVDIVNGLAVDSATGTACITTEGGPFVPPMVEFYDLAKQTGFGVKMSGANFGLDVEFDPVHKLFLVAQGDFVNFSVLVFTEKGTLKNTISVQKLPVSPSLIALNPEKRIGFLPVIVEPQHEFLELQSFRY